jgi:hypothetical protein
MLNEDLEFVRIKAAGKEIIITFDEQLEIVTIQEENESMK